MSDEKRKATIHQLFNSAKKKEKASSSIAVNGDRNIIGNGNIVVTTEKVVNNVVAEVKPGEDHITDSQAGILHELVYSIVGLEKILKKRPRTHQAVWLFLNRKMGVPRYRLIPYDKFEEAENFLRKEIGRLNSMRSAHTKNPDWRNSRYRFIHVNCKKHDLYGRMREYLLNNHGVESIKALTDDKLELTYQAVASWKRKAASESAAD